VDYTGSDDAAAQVHAQRLELAADCAAIAARLDAVSADTSSLASTVSGSNLGVDCGNCAGASATSGTDGDPTYVRLSSGDRTNGNLAQASTVAHVDLWFLIGALVGVVILVFGLQKVWP
jgi:hypothetical protein